MSEPGVPADPPRPDQPRQDQPRQDQPRTSRPARARSLSGPNCGSPVTVRASGSTVTATCPSCATVLDVADESVRIITQAQARTRTPDIPIGARGALDGVMWQAIGYQVRSTANGSWQWEEYLLFNPYQGFRFLAQDHGTWTLFKLLRDDLGDATPPPFKLTEENTARTEYVLGEFYWRVHVGDEVAVREFMAPPQVLSRESDGTEVTWSGGTVQDANEVRRAFSLPSLPGKAAAPSVWPMWRVAAIAAVLLLVLHTLPFAQYRNFIALRQDWTATAKTDLVSEPFELPGAGGNVLLEASAPAGTDYVNLRLNLLQVSGGRKFGAAMTLGSAFDGVSAPERAVLSSVPGGRYMLAAEIDSSAFPSTEPGAAAFAPKLPADGPAAVSVTVTVRRHPVAPANFWLTLSLLLAWPTAVTAWRWIKDRGTPSWGGGEESA